MIKDNFATYVVGTHLNRLGEAILQLGTTAD